MLEWPIPSPVDLPDSEIELGFSALQADSLPAEPQGTGVGLPFSSPGDLPHPGIEPTSPVSPALAGRFFNTEPAGKPMGKNWWS